MPDPAPDWEVHHAAELSDFEVMSSDDIEKSVRLQAYERWLRAKGVTLEEAMSWYERNSAKMQRMWESHEFWKHLTADLSELDSSYVEEHPGYHLLKSPLGIPRIEVKEFDRFLLKTLRKNVFLPSQWFSGIHDIVRTKFIVQHIDGVEFLIQHMSEQARNCNVVGLDCSPPDYKANMVGYYAAHIDLSNEGFLLEPLNKLGDSHRPTADFPLKVGEFTNFDDELPTTVTAIIEIQVTTQLQEVIQQVMHEDYEVSRLKRGGTLDQRDSSAPWDYTSEQFGVSYLGHVVRYVEGMIVQARMRREQIRRQQKALSIREVELRRQRQ